MHYQLHSTHQSSLQTHDTRSAASAAGIIIIIIIIIIFISDMQQQCQYKINYTVGGLPEKLMLTDWPPK